MHSGLTVALSAWILSGARRPSWTRHRAGRDEAEKDEKDHVRSASK
jgi:hypothetical protein